VAQASLRYVRCADAGICRVKRGKGFIYNSPNGKQLHDANELDRIEKLALPPAWRDVWICTDPVPGLRQALRRDLARPGLSCKKVLATLVSLMAETGVRVGNTQAICRKSYVHPDVMQAFLEDQLPLRVRTKQAGLHADERDLLALLGRRAARRQGAASAPPRLAARGLRVRPLERNFQVELRAFSSKASILSAR
jgi:DNA topoisomerase IB